VSLAENAIVGRVAAAGRDEITAEPFRFLTALASSALRAMVENIARCSGLGLRIVSPRRNLG
jgi:hypothetical protein